MEELLLRPLADAFLQVGVAVALLVAVVAWARVRYGTRALDVLVRHRRAAPALGALLGVSPGCGGAILAVGLYLKGRASYGTAIAALTATMGDASFVLLALEPRVGLAVHGVLLLVGTVTGYAVDAWGADPRRAGVGAGRGLSAVPGAGTASAPADGSSTPSLGLPAGAVAVVADPAATSPAGTAPLVGAPTCAAGGGRAQGPLLPVPSVALWVVAALGAVLAVPATLRLVDPTGLPLGPFGLDPWLAVGVTGFLACLVVFVRSGCRLPSESTEAPSDLRTALAEGAAETAFVVFWVSVAFVAQAVLAEVGPWSGSSLPLLGVTGVLVGVAVALLPGCGTQIAFTGLYASGALPLPALLANAVAQDGDALLPVLAQDRRAALAMTVLTSVPALLTGGLALLVL